MTDPAPQPADTVDSTDAATADYAIVVNGLQMPAVMWPRVMDAVHGLFPQITAGLSDGAAVQAVMREFIVEWISTWESRQAAPDPSVAASHAARDAQNTRDAASAKARSDCAAIVQTVTT